MACCYWDQSKGFKGYNQRPYQWCKEYYSNSLCQDEWHNSHNEVQMITIGNGSQESGALKRKREVENL